MSTATASLSPSGLFVTFWDSIVVEFLIDLTGSLRWGSVTGIVDGLPLRLLTRSQRFWCASANNKKKKMEVLIEQQLFIPLGTKLAVKLNFYYCLLISLNKKKKWIQRISKFLVFPPLATRQWNANYFDYCVYYFLGTY